jgi:hypothetical protein
MLLRLDGSRHSCRLLVVDPPTDGSILPKGCFFPNYFLEPRLRILRCASGAVYIKDIPGSQMSMRDHYLTRSAEFHARARIEYDGKARHDYENLARQYLRLAEQAERNEFVDLEPPPPKRRQS